MLELLQLDTGGALGEERALRVCLSVCPCPVLLLGEVNSPLMKFTDGI